MKHIFVDEQWMVPPSTGSDGLGESNRWYRFRATLSGAGSECRLSLAADSKYWLYVNGTLVIREGGLKRGPTPTGGYYDVVDVSEYLQDGANTMAVHLCYFGRQGFSHRDSGVPGLLVAADHGTLSGWKVSEDFAIFDAGYVRNACRLSESSVGYDARKADEGWVGTEYDDSAWQQPVLKGGAGSQPWGELEKRPVRQWFWDEVKEYPSFEVGDPVAGVRDYFCNLPENLHFVPVLEVESQAGLRIDILSTLNSNCVQHSYITRQGTQAYEFPLWSSGEGVVYRVPHKVKVIKLGYRRTGYPAGWIPMHSCSNERLNLLLARAQRTLYVTMRDNFMDCPCRERAQWPGDMVTQLGQIPYAFDLAAEDLVKKGLRETLRWQREDGIIYGPVPEGNWRMELPAQMLAVVSRYGIWTYYMNTGDLQTLEELYPFVKRYMELWTLQENGLANYRPSEGVLPETMLGGVCVGTWDWLDWGQCIDAAPLLNMWLICGLEGAAQMAGELGKTADADAFREKMGCVAAAVNAEYWNAEKQAYISPDFEFDPDDRVQGMAILAGVADESKTPALIDWLGRVEQASPYMEKYVEEALFKVGAGEQAIVRILSRYQTMLETDSSTLWEQFFDIRQTHSTINHSWSGGPLTLLAEEVVGVTPLTPGWSEIRIAPVPCGLSSFGIEARTVHGPVKFDAELEAGEWTVNVVIPTGMSAELDCSNLGAGDVPEQIGSGSHRFMVKDLGVAAFTSAILKGES